MFNSDTEAVPSVKALYTVEEVITENGGIIPLSKSAVYSLIRKGEIPSKRIGKRVFICGSYIRELMSAA